MFILIQNRKVMVNTDNLTRIWRHHSDILAYTSGEDETATTLARYDEPIVCELAFEELIRAISEHKELHELR